MSNGPASPSEPAAEAGGYPSTSLLGRLSASCRENFLRVGEPRSWQAGEALVEQGRVDSYPVLLRRGRVHVIASGRGGVQVLRGIRLGGDLVGEEAALAAVPCETTVIATTGVFGNVITRQEMRNFLAFASEATVELVAFLSERLNWSERHRVERVRPAGVRLASVLVELFQTCGFASRGGLALGTSVTSEELASLAELEVDVAEETVQTFRRRGLISGDYGRLAVLDMNGLRRTAELA